ncbi:MAG: hypothetical protein E6Q97_17990 [Desulfurellales bacterium]|nr:MAG: hypothetical protein E6Q97_17990 [Desulfurellales bacterium]
MELGELIDAVYNLRTMRIEAQRKVDTMKAEETSLKEQIRNKLDEVGLQRASGSVATAGVKSSTEPQVTDWDAVHNWIRDHNRFDLLQKRLSAPAWRDLYGEGTTIPGTEPVDVYDLSLTKASR